MKIKPAVIITLQKQSTLIVNELMVSLPPAIQGIHSHLSISLKQGEDRSILKEQLNNTLQRMRGFKPGEGIKLATLGVYFTCDLIFLVEEGVDIELIDEVSALFKKAFEETGKSQSSHQYDQLVICCGSTQANLIKNYNCYRIERIDSNRQQLSLDEFKSYIKYFFLFIFTVNLYVDEDDPTIPFYFRGDNRRIRGEDLFKTIDIVHDGIPYFELHDLIKFTLEERICNKMLSFNSEVEIDYANLLKIETGIIYENEEYPDMKSNSLGISFFSTKKNREKEIENFIKAGKVKAAVYKKEYEQIAEEERKDFENKVKEENQDISYKAINSMLQHSKSFLDSRMILNEVSKEGGEADKLINKKKIEWPDHYRFSQIDRKSVHPIWMLLLISFLITIIPWILYEYVFFIPFDYALVSSLAGFITGVGYACYSFINIRNTKKALEDNNIENLQAIEGFFKKSFNAFKTYLEVYLLRNIRKECYNRQIEILKNQVVWSTYYLLNFFGAKNYNKNIESFFKQLKENPLIDEVGGETAILNEMEKQIKENYPEVVSEIKFSSVDQVKDDLTEYFKSSKDFKNIETLKEQISNYDDGRNILEEAEKLVEKKATELIKSIELDLVNNSGYEEPSECLKRVIRRKGEKISELIELITGNLNTSGVQSFIESLDQKIEKDYYLTVRNEDVEKVVEKKNMLFLPKEHDKVSSQSVRNKFDKIYECELYGLRGFIKIVDIAYKGD